MHIYGPRSTINDFIRLWHQTSASFIMFDHYCCQRSRLQIFCLFIYMYVISIYLWKLANSNNIEFKPSHLRQQTYVQQHFTKPGSQAKIKLLGPLFDSDGLGNIIFADDPRTTEDYNDITIILLALFVP